MYIRKCDICGKEEKIANPMLVRTKENPPKYSITKYENNSINSIDLCEDCEKKLDIFFQNVGNSAFGLEKANESRQSNRA